MKSKPRQNRVAAVSIRLHAASSASKVRVIGHVLARQPEIGGTETATTAVAAYTDILDRRYGNRRYG